MEVVMKPKKSRKLLWGILGITFAIFLSLGAVGGIKYMDYQKEKQEQTAREHKLYKRGFRLLEEQIAIYTKEHYEGVSKIEFSPIFEDGGDYSMYTLDINVAIYDKHGNRAVMKRRMNESFGTNQGLNMDFDGGDGSEVIELEKYDSNEVVDVSNDKHLPEKAKLETYDYFDEVVEYLVRTNQLKDVKKSSQGSPDAKVSYNTEIKRGDYTKWR
ncbi:hypothetical protein EKS18_01460 [Streptococcus mutans]|nr:hypothetical protein [Streptococcus mutans]